MNSAMCRALDSEFCCRFCGNTVPTCLPVQQRSDRAMLLHHLGRMHSTEVRRFLDQMRTTEDIARVAMDSLLPYVPDWLRTAVPVREGAQAEILLNRPQDVVVVVMAMIFAGPHHIAKKDGVDVVLHVMRVAV